MGVQIKIDQAGKPPGVAGVAREDLATGVTVQATAIGGPFASYLWTLRDKPIDIVAATQAGAAISAATSSATNISPIDVAGTYALRLQVDAGFGLGARAEDVADITFYAGPTLSTDPTAVPQRIPAFSERTEHNVADAVEPLGNTRGWAKAMLRWFAIVKKLADLTFENFTLNNPTLVAGPLGRVNYLGGAVTNANLPSAALNVGGSIVVLCDGIASSTITATGGDVIQQVGAGAPAGTYTATGAATLHAKAAGKWVASP